MTATNVKAMAISIFKGLSRYKSFDPPAVVERPAPAYGLIGTFVTQSAHRYSAWIGR